jgi:hypothetical protein
MKLMPDGTRIIYTDEIDARRSHTPFRRTIQNELDTLPPPLLYHFFYLPIDPDSYTLIPLIPRIPLKRQRGIRARFKKKHIGQIRLEYLPRPPFFVFWGEFWIGIGDAAQGADWVEWGGGEGTGEGTGDMREAPRARGWGW